MIDRKTGTTEPQDAPVSPSDADGQKPRQRVSAGRTPAASGQESSEESQNAGSKRRSRARFGARRSRLPSERRLPPTQMHEGRVGTPEHLKGTEDETLKFYALGGLGEVGRNMYVMEYKDEIVIIDAGILFPQDNMPGIDFIVPDISSLEPKKDNIRALILTHGHMDHIGGVPYLLEKLGNPDIYTALLTEKLVLKRHSEFPHLPKPNMEVVKAGQTIKLGQYFTIEFFNMNHNIPDDLGLFIQTPVGNMVHTADFKFDPNPLYGEPANYPLLEEFGKRGVHTLVCESTDAEDEGHSISEQTVYENMEIIFKEAQGMLVFGTFSSMINRMQQIVKLSEKYGRKVIFDGYSLKTNVEIAKEIGYLTIDKGTQIPIEQIGNYPREKITVIATGALGQESASLMRIVNQEHRHLSVNKGDSVVFSSSVIPGNERSVQYLKDMLYRAGVKVYHYQMMDLHAGGHAKKEDLVKILDLLKPKFLIPHHGQYSMMVTLGEIGKERGVAEENIIIADNGQVVHLTPDNWWFDKKSVQTNYIMVDGLGVGDVGNVVLRDRQVLAEDGMFVIIAVVDTRTGQVRQSPDIISRGFVYLKEQKDLLSLTRKKIRQIVESEKARPLNIQYLKDNIRDEIGRFLFQRTERRPMVLPVIIEV
ncbi:MAG: ribonuclease J [Patescibacteria group bacterium]